MTGYIGINQLAQQIKGLYVGVGNVAKQAKKAYIGINGIAKLWYSSSYVWEKYTLMYSETTPVSAAFIYYSSAFRVGSTYSFNSNTGQFTVNQTINIANSSTGASNAVNKYYITLTSTSGSQTGTTVYKITDASYSSNQNRLTLRLQRIDSQICGKNTYVEDVVDDDILAYPINGPQDGFWYIRKFDYTLSYTGNYTETLAEMDGMYYRLLELTGSGTLTLGEAKQADIWICGGGGGGGKPVTGSGGGGGAGAYTASVNNINLQNLVVTIGAGGGRAANGSQTAISGDCSLTANGGGGGPYQTSIYGINPDGGSGGTGGGTGAYDGSTEVVGTGNGIAKTPFSSNYFTYPYCDGGGGGGKGASSTSDQVYGGAGGTNGGNGSKGGVRGYSGGAGGGHYGGKGGDGTENYVAIEGGSGTGYGSGGGGGGVYASSYWGSGGNGYQGVCIIRIPIPGVTPSSAPEPEPESLSDLTGTQWLFNENLNLTSNDIASYSLNFTSNSTSFNILAVSTGYNNMLTLQYTSGVAYYQGYGWANQYYRTISITGGTDATNATLIAWLQANATQVTS